MSFPCGYEYVLGQQPALQSLQLLYPGYPGLASTPAASLPGLPGTVQPHLLHTKQILQAAVSPQQSAASPPCSAPGPAPHQQNKKYRPPHKADKYTPKPIPPELGHLKTYSELQCWLADELLLVVLN